MHSYEIFMHITFQVKKTDNMKRTKPIILNDRLLLLINCKNQLTVNLYFVNKESKK
jgi:hypothetical protein